MFPAYRPTDIPRLPLSLYIKMREYYLEVKRAGQGPVSELPQEGEFKVVDFDKEVVRGGPV